MVREQHPSVCFDPVNAGPTRAASPHTSRELRSAPAHERMQRVQRRTLSRTPAPPQGPPPVRELLWSEPVTPKKRCRRQPAPLELPYQSRHPSPASPLAPASEDKVRHDGVGAQDVVRRTVTVRRRGGPGRRRVPRLRDGLEVPGGAAAHLRLGRGGRRRRRRVGPGTRCAPGPGRLPLWQSRARPERAPGQPPRERAALQRSTTATARARAATGATGLAPVAASVEG